MGSEAKKDLSEIRSSDYLIGTILGRLFHPTGETRIPLLILGTTRSKGHKRCCRSRGGDEYRPMTNKVSDLQ